MDDCADANLSYRPIQRETDEIGIRGGIDGVPLQFKNKEDPPFN